MWDLKIPVLGDMAIAVPPAPHCVLRDMLRLTLPVMHHPSQHFATGWKVAQSGHNDSTIPVPVSCTAIVLQGALCNCHLKRLPLCRP